MKTLQKIVPLIFLLAITISCSKDDIKKIEDKSTGGSYINFSVAGASKNGTFNISGKETDNPDLIYTGVVFVNADSNEGKAIVEFTDLSQEIGVYFTIPPAKGVFEITDTNPYSYSVNFWFGDIALDEKAISVNVTEIEIENSILHHIKGTFTGTAVYISGNDENGNPIEETHLVDGEFQYNWLDII